MDADWTEFSDGVTCPDCRALLRDSRSRTVTAAHERSVVERRDVDRW